MKKRTIFWCNDIYERSLCQNNVIIMLYCFIINSAFITKQLFMLNCDCLFEIALELIFCFLFVLCPSISMNARYFSNSFQIAQFLLICNLFQIMQFLLICNSTYSIRSSFAFLSVNLFGQYSDPSYVFNRLFY